MLIFGVISVLTICDPKEWTVTHDFDPRCNMLMQFWSKMVKNYFIPKVSVLSWESKMAKNLFMFNQKAWTITHDFEGFLPILDSVINMLIYGIN